MKIDIHNYEAWLLDYVEGRLDAGQQSELRAFLLAHPHLAVDIDSQEELPKVEPGNEGFSTFLLRKDLPSSDETKALEYLEGLMSRKEVRSFERRLRSDERLRAIVDQFRNVKFEPGAETLAGNFLRKDIPTDDEERVLHYREGLLHGRERELFEAEMAADPRLQVLNREFAACELKAEPEDTYPEKNELLRKSKVINLWMVGTRAAAVLVVSLFVTLLWPDAESTGPVAVVTNTAGIAHSKPIENDRKNSAVKPEKLVAETNTASSLVKAKKHIPSVNPAERIVQQQAQQVDPVLNDPVKIQEVVAPANIEVAHQPTEPEAELKQNAEPVTVVRSLDHLAFVEEHPDTVARKGFWEKAAGVVQQFGRLGFKGLEASRDHNAVSLTFNELSVEKKYSQL